MVNMKSISIFRFVFLFLFIFTCYFVFCSEGFPLLPSQFYGEIKIEEHYAPIGTNVSVYTEDGFLCGEVVIEKMGEYSISCRGDDPVTAKIEGAKENQDIIFYVNHKYTGIKVKWHEGGFVRVNLFLRADNDSNIEAYSPDYSTESVAPLLLLINAFVFFVIIIFLFFRMRDANG